MSNEPAEPHANTTPRKRTAKAEEPKKKSFLPIAIVAGVLVIGGAIAAGVFLLGGKKMASSKGIGAKAFDLANVYPPEITRFLMLRTHPKQRPGATADRVRQATLEREGSSANSNPAPAARDAACRGCLERD